MGTADLRNDGWAGIVVLFPRRAGGKGSHGLPCRAGDHDHRPARQHTDQRAARAVGSLHDTERLSERPPATVLGPGRSPPSRRPIVTDHDEDVLDASGLEIVEDPEPEPGAFGGLDPDAQDFLAALGDRPERMIITYYTADELNALATEQGLAPKELRQRPPLKHERQVRKLYLTATAT